MDELPQPDMSEKASHGISVLMAVYAKDEPKWLEECLASLAAQTLTADEIVIVQDGPVPDRLTSILKQFSSQLPITLLLKQTQEGLGAALATGLRSCKYSYIARMDADDECFPHRFETQVNFLKSNPEIDIVGGWISEMTELGNVKEYAVRKVPTNHDDIVQYARSRNPMNHMTVMFRRDVIRNLGGYRPLVGFEDYDLWVRAIMAGTKLANIPERLVWARAGEGLLNRRGGLRYFAKEVLALHDFYSWGFLDRKTFTKNLFVRGFVRLTPQLVRRTAYQIIRTWR